MSQKRLGQTKHDQTSWRSKMQKTTDFIQAKKARWLLKASPRQPVGIPQRDNKCYLNSTVQALLACGDRLSDFVAEAGLVSNQASELSSAFDQLRGGDGNINHEKLSPLQAGQQHEALEWTMRVIQAIEKEASLPSPLSFTKNSIKQCRACRCVRQCATMEETVMPVWAQDVSHEAQDWVGNYFDFSKLPDFLCTECGRNDGHEEWTDHLERTPEILVLDKTVPDTGTNEGVTGGPKLNEIVHLSAEQGKGKPESYKLMAVTVYEARAPYQGKPNNSGHYVAYRRGDSGRDLDGVELESSEWYEMNYDKFTPVSFAHVQCLMNVRALFYKKMDEDDDL